MSIINKAAVAVFGLIAPLVAASEAQAATSITITLNSIGSGFQKPDPFSDFNRTVSIVASSVKIAYGPTDVDGLFLRTQGDINYFAQFSDSGLALSTSFSGFQPFPQIDAFTCYSGAAVPTSVSYATPCGSYNLTVSFGGPPIIQFNGVVTSVTVEEGDTTGGAGVLYSTVVPEPSTWALMLAGFGMVGYAMRRRKLAFA